MRKELRAYAVAFVYLYVCLGALLLFKTGVLREVAVSPLHFGLAAVKALLLAKFMLIGEATGLGAGSEAPTLLHRIARRVVLFLVLLVALSVLEEFVAGWLRGHSFAQTLAEYELRSPLELFATCLLVGLVLVPFIGSQEVSRALGPGVLRRVLSQRA